MKFTIYKTIIIIRNIVLIIIAIGSYANINAQIAQCSVGAELSTYNKVVFDFASSGDLKINSSATLELNSGGKYTIYGALTNNGNIIVNNGAVLTVYGDVSNSNSIVINQGGVLNFYGKNWANLTGSVYGGHGQLNFTGSRPLIPASWTSSNSCLTNYEGGSFAQNLNGGNSNIRMQVDLHVKNSNNIILQGSTFLDDSVFFDVNDGHILLGSNNLTLSKSSKLSGYNNLRYFVTDDTAHLIKDSLAASSSFEFPIGRAEADYTPATITNTSGNYDMFYALVKNYTESSSIEKNPKSGMHRTWNIFSKNGSSVTIKLQHNSITNDSADYTTNGGDATAFVTQYSGAGIWQTGSGAIGTNAAGTMAGSRTHFRSYSSTVKNSNSNGAFFSKSNDLLTPLPISIANFELKAIGNLKTELIWTMTNDENIVSYKIYKLNFDSNIFEEIGNINSSRVNSGLNQYQFKDLNARIGLNIYKILIINDDGTSYFSEVKSIKFENNSSLSGITIFPNPAGNNKSIIIRKNNDDVKNKITFFNSQGKEIYSIMDTGFDTEIDIKDLPEGVYTILINGDAFKWVK